jgi:hypothetical protein
MNGTSVVGKEWSTFNQSSVTKVERGIRGRGNENATTILEEDRRREIIESFEMALPLVTWKHKN